MTEIVCPAKPKIFTLWPFTESICWSLCQIIGRYISKEAIAKSRRQVVAWTVGHTIHGCKLGSVGETVLEQGLGRPAVELVDWWN